jgi:hypothetical protein
VLLSRSTVGIFDDEEIPGVVVRDLGEHWLKDIDRPERIFELVVEGLLSDFPPLRTIDQQVRSRSASSTNTWRPPPVPLSTSPLTSVACSRTKKTTCCGSPSSSIASMLRGSSRVVPGFGRLRHSARGGTHTDAP